MILLRAELRIEARVIGDVVAVHAAGPRLEDRRSVDVADVEPRQIRHGARGVSESEFVIELQAVGGARWFHKHYCGSRLDRIKTGQD
jgi:hypothetical protein